MNWKAQTAKRRRQASRVPPVLRVFGWNFGERVGQFGQKQIALNVIEHGRAWHWRKLPKGWFDLQFCLQHGQRATKQTLRALFLDEE